MPEVGGVTAYTAGEILAGFDVHAPFIGPTCTSTNVSDSKYCILQQLYSPGQSATSDILWRSVNGANVHLARGPGPRVLARPAEQWVARGRDRRFHQRRPERHSVAQYQR